MNLFALRGRLTTKTKTVIEIVGALSFLLLWWVLVQFHLVRTSILPSPLSVAQSLPELLAKDNLLANLWFSVKINLLGYAEAVAIALPLGFLIGLVPACRGLGERILSAIRYLPLTALLGLFILWFGIATNMKVQFLTLGILVYLLPVVVQRIDEVQQVYVDTAKTIGANKWQTVTSVFIPDVVSRVADDILVLTALSWTYIIVVESINRSEGGIGSLFYLASRRGRVDEIFALILVILAVGFIQDKVWKAADRMLCPFKYN